MADHPPHSTFVPVAHDGLCTFEFARTNDVSGLLPPELDCSWNRFEVCPAEPGPVRGAGGVVVEAACDFDRIERADAVVISRWRDPVASPDRTLEATR